METAQGEPGSKAPPWGAMHPSQRPTPQAVSGRGFVCGALSTETSSPFPPPSAVSVQPRSRILPSQHLPCPCPSSSWVWPADTLWPSLSSHRAWACPHRQGWLTLADAGHSGSAPTLDFKLSSCRDQVFLMSTPPAPYTRTWTPDATCLYTSLRSVCLPCELRELDRHRGNDVNGEPC